MKVAAAAALLAALVLGLAVGGVFAQDPPRSPSDSIRLNSDATAAEPTPSPTDREDLERVEMRVEEDHLDDKGGRREGDEDRVDNSGRGSGDDREAEPDADDSENSGRGSDNSGSGSSGD